jgi:hypothetical protein
MVKGQFEHVQFNDHVYDTTNADIATELRDKPLYQGQKLVWEIDGKGNLKEKEKERVTVPENSEKNDISKLINDIKKRLVAMEMEKYYNKVIKFAKREFKLEISVELYQKILQLKDDELKEIANS